LPQRHQDTKFYNSTEFRIIPNVAKVEGAADSRRQGWSRSTLLRTLDNKGDAAPSAIPSGKQHGDFEGLALIHK